jgi:hypothetical protein
VGPDGAAPELCQHTLGDAQPGLRYPRALCRSELEREPVLPKACADHGGPYQEVRGEGAVFHQDEHCGASSQTLFAQELVCAGSLATLAGGLGPPTAKLDPQHGDKPKRPRRVSQPQRLIGHYFGCGTTRIYGFFAVHPCGNFCFASSSETAGTMITSSPGFQFTGVATLCFAVN